MKLSITIKYNDGETVTYMAGLPEWSKWERKTGKSIYGMTDISKYQQTDFLFLAHSAYVRAAAGKPTKSYESCDGHMWINSEVESENIALN